MLRRIISIRSVGRFRRCGAAGDVTFRRYTLVFAENGRGKTTLCAILRSLATDRPGLIIGRTTLGATEPTYVSENVFAGDVVATDHRRNLYRVIIGAQGVALATRINELDNQIRGKNEEIRENRARLQRYVPAGMDVNAFTALPQDAEIDGKIAVREQELHAVQRATELQQRAALAAVAIPRFPAGVAELLARTFAGAAADVERRVREHVARHRMQERWEPWVAEGLRYVESEQCPFCGQGLAGVDLIRAYGMFFTMEYGARKTEVTDLARQVDAAIGEPRSAAIERTILQNDNGVEFWRQYCDVAALPRVDGERVRGVMEALRQAAQALLERKAGMLLEAVPPDGAFTQALDAFEALRGSLGAYNEGVAAANAVIDARKRTAQAGNVREVQQGLARLGAQKARHEAEAAALCAAAAELDGDKLVLEVEKDDVRTRLDAHTAQVIARYGESINRYLERINAGFRITTPTHTYRGGPPSTSYQILINQRAVDLGDAETPVEVPSFRNTLSAGDRSTLALAFFLAQLEQDPDRAAKVVVFDDPFTSLDGFRRNHTVNQIYKCGENSAQVVLLSHEPMFLKLLWDRVRPEDRKALQLGRVGEDNTTIAEWNIERAVQAPYRMDVDTLQRVFADGEGEPRDVIRQIRPVLEGFCRALCPTLFEEREMMGGIIEKIQQAGAAHPLHPIVEDLEELNVYCRRYHHGTPGAALEPIDDAELQGYVRRTLRLVGHLP